MEQEKEEVKNEVNNERNRIIWIVVSILLVLAIGITIFLIKQNDKNYELENVTQFLYFKLYKDDKYGVIDAKRKYFSRTKV